MITKINKHYEIKKAMLIRIYEQKLINFDEFMNSLTRLMEEYDVPFIK